MLEIFIHVILPSESIMQINFRRKLQRRFGACWKGVFTEVTPLAWFNFADIECHNIFLRKTDNDRGFIYFIFINNFKVKESVSF